MYDVGRIRTAALAIYNIRPGAPSVLVLLGAAESAMAGLKERREDLSTLIGYEGAQQWDKDAARYLRWLEESTAIAEKIAAPGAPTPLWSDKYTQLLAQMFKGGIRAGVVVWATLSNQLDALEEAERTVYEQTSWLILWWAVPATELAATIGTAYDVQELKEDFAVWDAKLEKRVNDLVQTGAGIVGLLAVGAAIWFFWPLGVALIAARGRGEAA
jgi:hypothetical protein